MYTIVREYSFEAAHSLPHLPPDHKCHNLHGHSYTVEVATGGEVNECGWVMDFACLDAVVAPLITQLDHSNLNDHFNFPTTSELLAKWFYDNIAVAMWVSVSETKRSKAVYDGHAR